MADPEGLDSVHDGKKKELLAGFTMGEWYVEPLSGCFKRGGNRVHVEPKVMDVLLCLVAARGEVVTREQLLARVWTGLVVSEEVLTRAVSELRTLLGDTHRERRYVRTVPKRGYVLIAPVERAGAGGGESPDADKPQPPARADSSAPVRLLGFMVDQVRSTVQAIGRLAALLIIGLVVIIASALLSDEGLRVVVNGDVDGDEVLSAEQRSAASAALFRSNPADTVPTLAVMPFINLSGEAEQVFFSEGLSEDIRSALISVPGIRVVARTSSQAFKDQALDVREIGRRLGVAALVEGTVRIQNGTARITIQLTDTTTGFPIWSQSYDRSIDNVFSVQREISEAVVGRVAPQLAPQLPQPRVRNQGAYNLYLLGRHFWHQRTPEGVAKAVERFRKAIEMDPESALAYSGLADAYVFSKLYADMDGDRAIGLAQENASRALAIDPNLAEAHASQGLIHEYLMQFDQARKSFDRSVTLNPSNTMARMWYGNVLLALDEVSAAYQQYQQALEIDPLHPVIQQNFLEALIVMGRYQEAIKLAEQMYQVSAEGRLLKTMLRAMSQSGRYDELLRFAVRYNFAEDHKKSAGYAVTEALINLQRFQEAEVLIGQDDAPLEHWEDVARLRAKLALGYRDSGAMRRVIGTIDEDENAVASSKYMSAACIGARKHYWSGIADYMDGEFAAAIQQFEQAQSSGFLSCHFNEDTRISLLIYLGDSHNLVGNTSAGGATLQLAQQRLDRAAEKGWGQTSLRTSQIALHMINNDMAALKRLSGTLQREGVQPWSNLITHPIFDRHLQRQDITALLLPFKQSFRATRANSTGVKLAKYGL